MLISFQFRAEYVANGDYHLLKSVNFLKLNQSLIVRACPLPQKMVCELTKIGRACDGKLVNDHR